MKRLVKQSNHYCKILVLLGRQGNCLFLLFCCNTTYFMFCNDTVSTPCTTVILYIYSIEELALHYQH